jgi:hypothetical protein
MLYTWVLGRFTLTSTRVEDVEVAKRAKLSETFRAPLNKLSSQQTMLLGTIPRPHAFPVVCR